MALLDPSPSEDDLYSALRRQNMSPNGTAWTAVVANGLSGQRRRLHQNVARQTIRIWLSAHHYRPACRFFKVTEDALVYAAEAMKLDLSPEARRRLLNAYLTLKPWPDAAEALHRLRASGIRIISIANFSAKMLRSNAEGGGMADLFDELLSTEVNGTYKPDPRAYQLGMERLKLKKQEIVFAAFGGWDAYGAKRFGYPTYWVNRFGLPAEELGIEADGTSTNMDGLLTVVFGHP